MESIKPSFDVLLQTGLHRGLHSRYLKKRRPHASKSLHDGIDRAGRRGHDSGHGAGEEDVTESRHSADWHSRPSTVVGDSEKRRSYDRELDRGVRLLANFRELSPAAHKTGGDTFRMKDDTSGDSLSAVVMRASRLPTDDDLGDISSGRRALLRSSDYRYHPGAAVISVDELPRPQRGTYLVETVERPTFGDDSAWSSAGSSVGPHRPISLHGDELLTYMQDAESTPHEFTLDSLLGSREKYRQRQQSVGTSSANVYTGDDDISNLHRFLDNPFTGHSRRQQVCHTCVNHGYVRLFAHLSI